LHVPGKTSTVPTLPFSLAADPIAPSAEPQWLTFSHRSRYLHINWSGSQTGLRANSLQESFLNAKAEARQL